MSPVFGIWAMSILCAVHPFEETKFQSVFEQQSDSSCGIASVASLASLFWGIDMTEDRLLRLFHLADGQVSGFTMYDLKSLLEYLGFTAEGFRLEYKDLLEASHRYGPTVVHLDLDGGHFVLFLGEAGGYTVLGDPSRGCVAVATREFVSVWTRTALVVFHPDHHLDEQAISQATGAAYRRLEILRRWCEG